MLKTVDRIKLKSHSRAPKGAVIQRDWTRRRVRHIESLLPQKGKRGASNVRFSSQKSNRASIAWTGGVSTLSFGVRGRN